MLKIRRPLGRLIFNMGIAIPGKTVFLIETAPWSPPCLGCSCHYNDVTMRAMASQVTSLTIVYSNVYSGTDQRKHQSSTSLAFVRGIHRWPVNSPHKGPVTCKNVSIRWRHHVPPLLNTLAALIVRNMTNPKKKTFMQTMAWHQAGDKPSVETRVARFA